MNRNIINENIYLSALNFINTGNYDTAIAELKKIIETDYAFISAYTSLVAAFQKQEYLDGAESWLNSIPGNAFNKPYCAWAAGRIYAARGNYDRAAGYFREALEYSNGFPEACFDLVDLFCKYKKENAGGIKDIAALENLFTALLKTGPAAAHLYAGLGYLYEQQKNSGKALPIYDKAIALAPGETNAYYRKAVVLCDNGDYAAALRTLEKSLQKAYPGKNISRQCDVFSLMGLLHGYNGNNGKSLEYLDRALGIAEKTGDADRTLKILYDAGNVLLNSGNTDKADSYYRKTLALSPVSGDKHRAAASNVSWGRLYKSHGINDKAILNFGKALAFFRDNNDVQSQVPVLYSLSECYLDLQEYEQAMSSIKQASAAARETGDEQSGIIVSSIEAKILAELGDYETAIDYLDKALLYFREKGNRNVESIVLWNIGLIYSQCLKEYPAALEYFDKALAINKALSRTINEQDNLCGIYNNIGLTKLMSGKFQDALEDFGQAYNIVLKTGNKQREAYILNHFALVNVKLKNYRKADTYGRKALELGRMLGKIEVKQFAYFVLGENYHAQGDYAKAEICYQHAIDLIESRRDMLESEDYKTGYFQGLTSVYDKMINLQYDWHRKKPGRNYGWLSFCYAEVSKARSFLDMIRESRMNTSQVIVYPAMKIGEIREALVKGNTLLVEYKFTEDGLFTWAVTEKDFKIYKTGISAGQLQGDVKSLRNYITGKAEPAEFAARAYSLYRLLLEPVLTDARDKDEIIIAPDGILNYLPFDVLVDNIPGSGNNALHYRDLPFLLKKYTVYYCPSFTAAKAMQEQKKNRPHNFEKDLFAMGDPVYAENAAGDNNVYIRSAYNQQDSVNLPQLIYSSAEVRNIAGLFRTADVFLKEQATKAEVLQPGRLEKYRFIHFAAHGLLNENNPGLSGLVLSGSEDRLEDNILGMGEIFGLKTNADLVVLSACNTGLGKIISGEGVVGLIRSWLSAGASSVVSSLWSVDDKSTAYMMEEFYKNIKLDLSLSKAIREAKLTLIKTGNTTSYDFPYYWAGFILTGIE